MQKSLFGLVITVLFLGLSLSSCKKDPTFTDKMVGTWKSNKVTYDGTDASAIYHYTIILNSNKSFDLTQTTPLAPGSVVRKGTWEADNSREDIILHYDDSSDSDRYEITGLTGSQLNAEIIVNSKRLDIVFVK
jgi:hypothetical protein